MKKILSISFLVAVSYYSFAGGYRVGLQGSRQAGIGHINTGSTQDASSIFFNPAALSFAKNGIGVSLNAFGLNSTSYYQNKSTNESYQTDNPMGTPFQVGVYYKKNKLAIGLNACTPFGSSAVWPDSWTGNNLIQNISLKAIYIQPTIAYKINDEVSIGASYNYVSGGLTLQKAITNLNGNILLDGTAKGSGYSIGIYGRPNSDINWSLSYRSKTLLSAENQSVTLNIPSSLLNPANGPIKTLNDKFSAKLPLVSELSMGISYKLAKNLTIAGEINYSAWSQYKSLTLDFDSNMIGNNTTDITISETSKNFRNTTTYRVGAEWNATQKLSIRGGYYYDPSPVSSQYWSPETPSNDINAFTAGIGFKANEKLTIDLSGMGISGKERAINNTSAAFSGDVKSDAWTIGLGISYNLNNNK